MHLFFIGGCSHSLCCPQSQIAACKVRKISGPYLGIFLGGELMWMADRLWLTVEGVPSPTQEIERLKQVLQVLLLHRGGCDKPLLLSDSLYPLFVIDKCCICSYIFSCHTLCIRAERDKPCTNTIITDISKIVRIGLSVQIL